MPPSVSLFLVHREASSQLELKAIKRTFQTKFDEEAILVEDFADFPSSEEEPQASDPSETQATVWTSEPSTTSFAVQIVPDGAYPRPPYSPQTDPSLLALHVDGTFLRPTSALRIFLSHHCVGGLAVDKPSKFFLRSLERGVD